MIASWSWDKDTPIPICIFCWEFSAKDPSLPESPVGMTPCCSPSWQSMGSFVALTSMAHRILGWFAGLLSSNCRYQQKPEASNFLAIYDLPRILKISMCFWYQIWALCWKRHFESMVPNARKSGKGCIQDLLEFLTQLDTVLIYPSVRSHQVQAEALDSRGDSTGTWTWLWYERGSFDFYMETLDHFMGKTQMS